MGFFNDAVKSGFFMYMAEAEGQDDLVNTRQAKINAVIRDADKSYTAALNRHNIQPTKKEEAYLYEKLWGCRK